MTSDLYFIIQDQTLLIIQQIGLEGYHHNFKKKVIKYSINMQVFYTLIADGRLIDTKRMILTD